MNITKTYGTFPSSNGSSTVHYTVWKPDCNPSAMVQIAHGMCENVERYDGLARYLCEQGFIVYGNDHIGHGRSVDSDDQLGYFAEEDGDLYLVRDVNALNQLMKKTYRSLPTVLLGHSMGSFIARAYLMGYGNSIDGLILSGTSGGGKPLGLAKWLCKRIAKSKGTHYRSDFIHNLVFGRYSKPYAKNKNFTGYEWITNNPELSGGNAKDFRFTVQGFYDLFTLLEFVNSDEWYQKVPKGLPIYLISGSEDPVGDYGKDLPMIAETLLDFDSSDIEYKLYDGERHDLISGLRREEVMGDIGEFVNKVAEGVQEARRASYWSPSR